MASMAFVGCTNDEYLGTAQTGVQGGQGAAITFSGLPGNITRATQTPENSAATLKYNFSVLGTKTVGSDEKGVFVQDTYTNSGVDDANLYDVWYGEAQNTTTTNAHFWEYVGEAGAKGTPATEDFTLDKTQTIKYWDYAASQYDFIAYANTVSADIAGASDISVVTTDGFKVKASPTQLAEFYIADKVVMKKDATDENLKFGKDVKFTFRAASTKVRLGIYETVPGYKVTSIKFRYYTAGTTEDTDDTNNGNAILNGSFIGTTGGELTATVSYDTDNKAVLTFNTVDEDINKTFFNFGSFTVNETTVMGTTSLDATWTNKDYTDVFPNTTITSMSDMTLWVDYVLTGEDNSAETITVTGAKAVVPAAYMTWHPNHKYTYLFKISDNTNGYTDPNEQEPAGLYPIVFDAVVDVTEDGETNTQGTITTVAEPTITTYQAGSVVAEGVKYKADDIDITVVKGGTKVTLSNSNLEVWTGFVGKTEADLALSGAFNNATKETAVSFNDGVARFTATAGTNYAVVYIDTDNNKKHYKLIEVPAVTP